MANLSDISINIVVNNSQADAAISQTADKLKSFGNAAKDAESPVSKLGDTLKRGLELAGVTLAMGELVSKLKESTQLAATDAVGKAELARQLQATTHATAAQTEAINAQLDAMERNAAVSIDKLRPAYEVLLRATGNATTSMAELSLATDIAAGTHKNLTTVASALAKAHDGNYAALQKLVPGIKDATDKMGYLQTEFKGAAQTAADANPYQRLQIIFEQIQKSIGADLLPILSKFADWLAKVSPKIEQFFKDLGDPTTKIGKQFKDMTDFIAGAVKAIVDNGQAVLIWVGIVGGAIAAVKLLTGAIEAYKAIEFLVIGLTKGLAAAQTALTLATAGGTEATTAMTTAQWLLNIAMDANPIGILIGLVGGLAAVWVTLAGNTQNATQATEDYLREYGKLPANMRGSRADQNGLTPGEQAAIDDYNKNHALAVANTTSSSRAAAQQADAAARLKSGGVAGIFDPAPKLPSSLTPTTATKSGSSTSPTTVAAYITATQGKITAANNQFLDSQSAAMQTYADATQKATQEQTTAMEALDKQHAQNVANIMKQSAAQLQSIVQQSMDILRNAFAQGTSFDVGSTFSSMISNAGTAMAQVTQVIKNGVASTVSFWGTAASTGVDGLLQTMKSKLSSMKDLQANAAALQGAGFSQAFIAQVVQAGPDVGNQLAKSILASSSDTQQAMSDTFNQIQDVSANGMNDLAKTIYDKSGLQTDALKQMYADATAAQTQALADEAASYAQSQTDINTKFTQAMTDADATMKAAVKSAAQTLFDSLNSIESAFNAKLLTFKGGLSGFQSAIADLRNSLNADLASTSLLATPTYGALGSGSAGLTTSGNASAPGSFMNTVGYNAGQAPISVTVNASTDATPQAIADTAVLALKYGVPLSKLTA